MLKQERQDAIMELLNKQQHVRVSELMELLKVSNETIRRDLLSLEAQGQLQCVHGGAICKVQTAREPSVELRLGNHAIEKIQICRRAAALIEDGDSLVIGGSTTTASMGKLLKSKNNLTVITNSLDLAHTIAENPSNSVVLTGGQLNVSEQKTYGSITQNDFRQFCADKAFISAAGISVTSGITDYTEAESDVLQTILSMSNNVYLLNDYSKFEIVALRKICNANEISGVITDWKASRQKLLELENMGLKIFIAQKPTTDTAVE